MLIQIIFSFTIFVLVFGDLDFCLLILGGWRLLKLVDLRTLELELVDLRTLELVSIYYMLECFCLWSNIRAHGQLMHGRPNHRRPSS